jgi:AcrR family transcriptional regulator
MTPTDSARRAQLLRRLVDYSKSHGLSEVSMRPLAAAVGSSPRVLLYFFGSKDGLIREVHGHLRREQLQLVEQSVLAGHQDPAETLRALWTWLSDPAHADVERFFFESYARSLHGTSGPWTGFGETSVREWLPHLTNLLGDGEHPSTTFVLATLRGLLLDLLATGDRDRIQHAFHELLGEVT